ncbi:hypothetical protein [Mycolicibacterium tokaiense]|uniref:Transmembrane protein n=1 Tax=Mycolicibacterium tokaiense TaxID=39695 RepID=A0A378T8L0_9MYCO|nr:hypothetical protein [Mycolicibacterium tokaiense]BBY88518.1 hypothetical protein MTOK_43000 [Mycolicibacterium tokaiense]STZ56960.1 Uncharacterised protein [Mycolicibacterium tokaiense]
MTAPATPRVLLDAGGLVVTDDGRRVNVIDRATGGLATAAFVLGVIAVCVAGFGVVALVTGSPSRLLGGLFLIVGLAVAGPAYYVVRKIRNRRTAPLSNCRSVAVLDRKLNLFTVAGGALLPLDRIRFEKRLQFGSSSPKLVAVTPGGVHVLKRGNPFIGSISNADEVLNAVVGG